VTFAVIWGSAFIDDYLDPLPEDSNETMSILVRFIEQAVIADRYILSFYF
jgi:hypothetical protein